MFKYRIRPVDISDWLVTVGYDATAKQTMWNFTSFSNGYHQINTNTIKTPTSFPIQTILSGALGSENQNASLIQLYYGNTFPVTNYLRIEVVQPTEDFSGGISLPSPTSSQDFPIAWPAHQSSEYLLWFLSDVDGDGNNDLVGYASSDSNTTLTVVVFPGQADGKFSTPVTSAITLPAQQGSLFTASFMYPVYARQAVYTYPASPSEKGHHHRRPKHGDEDPVTSNAGILGYFDNYGIIGARMIAPVTAGGTFKYEFKGQTPAVAGQLSGGLGWRAQNLMGRGEASGAIGFAECC